MITVLSCFIVITAFEKGTELPDAVRADLNRHAGAWRLVSIKQPGAGKCVSVVTGDFDGNGQSDYAVYIVAGKGPTEKRQRLILYLKNGEQYSRRTLSRQSPNNDECLGFFRKGTKDYRYDTHQSFRYRYDTVGLFSEKAGESYLYRRGRFYAVLTSD
jgi:hypothetical protein